MKIKKISLILLTVTMAVMCAFTGCFLIPDNSGDHSGNSSSGITEAAVLDGVQITKAPNKTKYIAGETFDKTGMEVSAHYSDGSLKPVTSYFIDKTGELTVEDTYVTITYNKYKVQQPITVKAPSIYSFDVESSDNEVYRYEAEKQDVSNWALQSWNANGFIVEDYPDASGGKYLGNLSCDYNAQQKYNEIIVTVNSTVEAVGTLSFSYAGGWELGDGTFRDGVVMTWNDTELFIPADKIVQTSGWFDYQTYAIVGLKLDKGVNTFKMKIINAFPNIDYFELEVNPADVTVDEGLLDAHYCESVCEICGNCTNADCTKVDCTEKCLGHHENGCESVCEICGNCTDSECDKTECAEKCEGHTYGTDMVFKADGTEVSEKASKLFSEWLTGADTAPNVENGAIANTWKIANSQMDPGSFTIYAEEAKKVDFFFDYIWGSATANITGMEISLNGEKVEFTAQATQGDWSTVQRVTLATMNLTQGVNTIEIKVVDNCPNMVSFGFKLHEDAPVVDTPVEDTPTADMTLGANDTEVSEKATVLFSEWLTGADTAPNVENGAIANTWKIANSQMDPGSFTIYAEEAKKVDFFFDYIWGNATANITGMEISLNGEKVEFTAQATQGDWSTAQRVTLVTMNLNKGVNTIEIKVVDNCPNMVSFGFKLHEDAPVVDTPVEDTPTADMTLGANDTEVSEKATVLFSEWLTGADNTAKEENGMIADIWKLAYHKCDAASFTIYAEEEVTVEFFYTYGWSSEDCNLGDRVEITLNSEAVTAGGDVVKSDGSTINSVVLANMTLKKGVNTITLKVLNTIPNMNTFGFRVVTSQAE